MASFQRNVLLVAIIIFVVLMVFIAVMMNNAQKKKSFSEPFFHLLASLASSAAAVSFLSPVSSFSPSAFSLFQVPYIALPAELVSDYNARTRLLSARVVVLTFAILLFGAGGPALRSLGGDDSHLGYLIMEYPFCILLQKLPVNKVMAATVRKDLNI